MTDAMNGVTRVDGGTPTYSEQFDTDIESASEAVVRVVSAVTDTPPDELEPIDNVVDPIVFDALVRRQRRNVRIEFVYSGQTVAVESTGRVAVHQGLGDCNLNRSFEFADGESTSETVVRAIAEARDAEPAETPRLYDYVDTEALNRIIDPQDEQDTRVSFRYEDIEVVVSSRNGVTLHSRTSPM